jgi:hypothetical protein
MQNESQQQQYSDLLIKLNHTQVRDRHSVEHFYANLAYIACLMVDCDY